MPAPSRMPTLTTCPTTLSSGKLWHFRFVHDIPGKQRRLFNWVKSVIRSSKEVHLMPVWECSLLFTFYPYWFTCLFTFCSEYESAMSDIEETMSVLSRRSRSTTPNNLGSSLARSHFMPHTGSQPAAVQNVPEMLNGTYGSLDRRLAMRGKNLNFVYLVSVFSCKIGWTSSAEMFPFWKEATFFFSDDSMTDLNWTERSYSSLGFNPNQNNSKSKSIVGSLMT